MKLQENLRTTQLTESVTLVKVDKQKYIGSIKPHEGHTLYEFNKVNFQLQKAKFEPKNYFVTSLQENHKVKINDNCFYVSALNVKNAVKHINKKFNPEFVLVLTD